MSLLNYWKNLEDAERVTLAQHLDASLMTVQQKYMCPAHSREVPRKKRMNRLIELVSDKVSRDEVLNHFYPFDQDVEEHREAG